MTDVQIENIAWEYARKICIGYDNTTAAKAFIAGAHSRDKEIEELKEQRDNFKDRLLDALEKRDQLRNPWISVEERLPEKARGLYELEKDEQHKMDLKEALIWIKYAAK